MENNKLCNWILHYSCQFSKSINSENIIDVESSISTKLKFCSSTCYCESGQVLFDDFPDVSMGFMGILDYLCNHKGNVMDRLQDEQQRLYINYLKNSDNFSMRHHVSIIKCFMKMYVCQLVPRERINEALETIGVAGIMEIAATYRHVQRCLSLWLREAAIIGIFKLSNNTKSVTRTQAISIVDISSVGSLVLYAVISYSETNLVKYTVKIPDTESPVNGYTSDLSLEHSKIVLTMFLDFCGNRDLLPLDIDGLLSEKMDSVPVTLTVALMFHWIIGNSLRKLGNHLSTSRSYLKSDRSPSHRPSNLSYNNNANDVFNSGTFFINDNKAINDSLRQLFVKGKDERCRVIHNKSSFDGDTSSEVCLTPTDEEFHISPQIKPLPYNLFEHAQKLSGASVEVDPLSFSLKAEFQKKLKVKQGLTKLPPRQAPVTGIETTWFEQSNKSDTVHVPLTPKKSMKSSDILSNNSSNPSKTQLNQIQLQLSLQRQKIENDKKTVFDETEKSIENSKQKAFFQALDRDKKLIRRRSLIVATDSTNVDRSEADKRLSMYIKRTSENVVTSPIRRLGSREISRDDNNVMEPPQSSQISDTTLPSVHICLDVTNDVENMSTNDINVVPGSMLTRNNNSASISSLSSFSNMSVGRNLFTKEDYERSIEKLNDNVHSLQEQVRMLKDQRANCTGIGNNTEDSGGNRNIIHTISENNSVTENHTNNGLSLTDVTDLPRLVTDIDIDQMNGVERLDCVSSKQSDCEVEALGQCILYDSCVVMSQLVSHDGEVADIDHNGVESNMMNGILNESPSERASEEEVNQDPISNQPISFMVMKDEISFDVSGKKAEIMAKNVERRLQKMEQFKQKREHDREIKLVVTNDDLLENKTTIHKENKDDSLVKIDECSNHIVADFNTISLVKTPVRSVKKSQTLKSDGRRVKQDSVENLPLASSRKNNGFLSILPGHRQSSYSTSKLNLSVGPGFAASLPSQEYIGPKLFTKQKSKSNRTVIANAISYCCLAGSVNTTVKDCVLKDLNEADGNHFMILFRDSRCQYKSLYLFDFTSEELIFVSGNGPKKITHDMVERFFKYNSGTKQFNAISSTKHLSTAVDAVCIQSSHWNTRPTGHILTSALSTNSITQTKTKR